MSYQPKKYFCNQRTLKWGKDLTKEQVNSLKKGEVFILHDKNDKPHSQVLMDSYNQIREGPLKTSKLASV